MFFPSAVLLAAIILVRRLSRPICEKMANNCKMVNESVKLPCSFGPYSRAITKMKMYCVSIPPALRISAQKLFFSRKDPSPSPAPNLLSSFFINFTPPYKRKVKKRQSNSLCNLLLTKIKF